MDEQLQVDVTAAIGRRVSSSLASSAPRLGWAIGVLALLGSACATTRPLPATIVLEPGQGAPAEAVISGKLADAPEAQAAVPPVPSSIREPDGRAIVERKTRAPPPPPSDPELAAALLRFSTRAQKERASVGRGGALPKSQEQNWDALIDSLDAFLSRPAWQTERPDVLRARATLEAELARDARQFGNFPAELADKLMERLTFMAVRLAELKRLSSNDDAETEASLFSWPLQPVHITSLFGNRRHPISRRVKMHRGIDLAARKGQPVLSAGGGTVVRAGKNGDYGLQVTVEHASGLQTRYSHLSQILVEVGMRLEEGEVLGLAGRTGRATGVHLHFEVWRGNHVLDPLDFLREVPEPPSTVSHRS